MPEVVVDGAKVHYSIRPGGPRPVVFLHGGFGSSSELWTRTMEAMPGDYTGYAIDNFLRSEAMLTWDFQRALMPAKAAGGGMYRVSVSMQYFSSFTPKALTAPFSLSQ